MYIILNINICIYVKYESYIKVLLIKAGEMNMNNSGEKPLKNLTGRIPESHVQMVNALNKALDVFISYNKKSLDDIMTDGIKPIAESIGLDLVCVYRYKDTNEGKRLGMTYLWKRTEGGTAPLDERVNILPDIPAIKNWLDILLKGNIINSRVCDMSEDEAAFLRQFKVNSIFIMPIFTHGNFWGAITLQNHTSGEYFPDGTIEAEILQASAYSIARAFIHAEAKRDSSEKNELSQVLFNTSPIGLTTFDEHFNFIDCNKALIKMLGIEKQCYLKNFHKLSPKYQPDGSISRDKALEIMKRALNGNNIRMEWMHCTPTGEPVPCEVTLTRIKQGGKYIGLGYLYDLRSIKNMEESIYRLENEVEKIYYDPLTGIYNRRYFDKTLNHLIKSLSRSGSMLSLMMIDVDFFKKYNDMNGHPEGDKCLIAVAKILAQSITRETDFIARYGGEEFAVVLPNTDEKGACKIAEKMIENIRNGNIPYDKNEVTEYVTISIGVTSGKVKHTHNEEDYIKQADKLLYISKQGGRNKYTFETL